jgi:hypothetical protein
MVAKGERLPKVQMVAKGERLPKVQMSAKDCYRQQFLMGIATHEWEILGAVPRVVQ